MKGKLVMARLVMMIRSLLEIMTKILKTIYWGYLGQENDDPFLDRRENLTARNHQGSEDACSYCCHSEQEGRCCRDKRG